MKTNIVIDIIDISPPIPYLAKFWSQVTGQNGNQIPGFFKM